MSIPVGRRRQRHLAVNDRTVGRCDQYEHGHLELGLYTNHRWSVSKSKKFRPLLIYRVAEIKLNHFAFLPVK